ncbi:hypothetical protein [Truepera radiovictrix]|nr:hypothetical protein [Truepera radiovictrix]WMT55977.1 hypothetical protein RCV51_08100 [Truepera radiovictrix]
MTDTPPDAPPLEAALAAFADVLEKARADPELAAALRRAARALLAALPEPREEAPQGDEGDPSPAAPPATADEVAALVATFARRAAPEAPVAPQPLPLEAVPARLRLKARACRWLREHGFTNDEEALRARYRLLDEGRAAGCHLWMLDPNVVNPYATTPLETLAAAFDAAARLLEAWLASPPPAPETELAPLLDEAQGALRGAVAAVHTREELWFDEDQRAIFEDLKRYGAERRLFLPYLSLKRHPDPAASAERLARLEALLERSRGSAAQLKERQKALNRLAYHARQLVKGSPQPAHEWARLEEAFARLLELGVPESDPALREHLGPLAPLRAAAPAERLGRVLELCAAPKPAPAHTVPPPPPPDPLVAEAAALLAGRTLVLIGGEPRPEAREQLEAALGCRVDWPDAPKHASPDLFKPAISRQEVGAVLLLIRWSSHVFGELEPLCAAHGKPFVRVTGGYNPRALARAILEQAGEQLRAQRAAGALPRA